ncbi:MAG: hypothetical protein OEZ58_01025 [Gammaproteobacteria bacterium]|nr:hypothetical protein [Gammaproteobacteria bacterium]MDH5727558.1 hypothetical protein [Gammaproteobacteria bacterium]
MKIVYSAVLILIIGFLTGCGGAIGSRPIDVVTHQVEEKRLVPASAMQKTTILDAYHHILPFPDQKPIELHLYTDRSVIDKTGDKVVLQIGLSTLEPMDAGKEFHYLFFQSDLENAKTHKDVYRLFDQIEKQGIQAKWTSDWSHKAINKHESLLKHKTVNNLNKFLRRYIMGLEAYERRHFVLVMADEMPVSERDQQNALDMTRYLATKGSSLSVIALGSKPPIGFLKKLSDVGNGTFSLYVDAFNLTEWNKAENYFISARQLTEINLDVKLSDEIISVMTISGAFVAASKKEFNYSIESVRQGEQRVSLYELTIPAFKSKRELLLAEVTLSAFDKASGQYVSDTKEISVELSNDKNLIHSSENDKVKRSLAILRTPEIVAEAGFQVQNKRPYKAMETILNHRKTLQQLAGRLNDQELQYDTEVLTKYELRLYEFADELMQSLKSWKDLSVDGERFQ